MCQDWSPARTRVYSKALTGLLLGWVEIFRLGRILQIMVRSSFTVTFQKLEKFHTVAQLCAGGEKQ